MEEHKSLTRVCAAAAFPRRPFFAAIVIAFLQVGQLVTAVELAKLKSGAKAHFDGFLTPAGWDFEKICTDFVTYLRRAADR
jgi:hypothetical protein